MAKWYVTTKKADFYAVAEKYKIDPILARIIRNRDMTEEKEITLFLKGTLKDLHSPHLMRDMDKGVQIIHKKIQEGKSIRIIGDYDIDGICASFILKRGLETCSAKADVVIPHRIIDGYGLNNDLIQAAFEDGIDTIITCDNGIAAKEQIHYAKELGMTVVLTDHHEVPYEEQEGKRSFLLPDADAVIDPKREDCQYPFAGICGGMVAYKFIEALLEYRKEKAEVLEELLEFAAFATIGDVMELTDENRIIVKYGLLAMRHTQNTGLKALIEVNGIEEKQLSPYHIGFVLGPCLNATGRLDYADRALALLEEKDRNKAVKIAGDLKALNDSRKELTQIGVEEAVKQIEETALKEDKVLVIYLPKCHESLAGIIAGRIREKYGKPTFVLTQGENGIKGSGRSIDAFSMYEEMNKQKHLLTKFGGHKLAAGLSMEKEKIECFRREINRQCSLTEEDFEEKIIIDVPMPVSYVSEGLIQQLEQLEPFGAGNPKPVFAEKNIKFLSGSILGKNRNVAKFVVSGDTGTRMNMTYFGDIEKLNQYIEQKYGIQQVKQLYDGNAQDLCLSVIYYPTINEFRGNRSIQLVMKDYQ